MKRREFLLLGVAAAAFPRVASAQQTARQSRPWMIAALITTTKAQSDIDTLTPFVKGFGDLGYVDGRDYKIEARYTDGDITRYAALAKELVGLSPDLILAANGASALALHALTQTIPIVAYITEPTNIDLLIGSRARPISNVTGVTTDSASLTGKHCDLALEILPRATRIGALASLNSAETGKGTRDAVTAAAAIRKFTPVVIDVAPADAATAFRTLADQRVDAVVVGSGFNNDRAAVARAAADARLPTVYNEQGYVEVGGLISYGFSRISTFTRLAAVAELLLKGSRVVDVPFEETSTYFTAINLKTAKSLGLTIPSTVLFRADLVIEA